MSLEAVQRYGTDALAFAALKSGTRWWHDLAPPDGTGALQPYVVSRRSWIGIGSPLASEDARPEAVSRFAAAARAAGCRAVFVAVEDLRAFAGLKHLRVGQQPVLEACRWSGTLARLPKLREQVRRARAKGVVVRRLAPDDLAAGSPARRAAENLAAEWLASRRMEPMGFLVALEPFHAMDEHIYLLAERQGTPVQFLSAVPIAARGGWLIEDVFRSTRAPNGTAEIVIDRLMREVGDAAWLTHGLTPLAGDLPTWLRVVRTVARPLYDFRGLYNFRARLAPARWDPVWLVWDRGRAVAALIDVLAAFARGRLGGFTWRSLTRHPNGLAWAVAVPLIPWIMLLAVLAESGHAAMLGYSAAALRAWIAFDIALAWALFAAARRPRRRLLAMLTLAASVDAWLSTSHLVEAGLGTSLVTAALRGVATLGPVIGTLALARATWLTALTPGVDAARPRAVFPPDY